MTLISGKLLAGIVAVLTAVVVLLGGMSQSGSNVNVSVLPDVSFGAVGALISPIEVAGARGSATLVIDRMTFRTGTSTVCSFKTPNATTTGTVAAQALTVPHAQVFQIANAATPNATTTDLGTFTTTALAATVTTIYPPNSFINVKAATSSGTVVNANFAPTGSCAINLTVI